MAETKQDLQNLLQQALDCFLEKAALDVVPKDAKAVIAAVNEHIDCSHFDTSTLTVNLQGKGELLEPLIKAVEKYGASKAGFFTEMLEDKVALRAEGAVLEFDTQSQLLLLQVCIGYFMAFHASEDLSLQGVCFYARLLALPDALSYRVFHPNLIRTMHRAVEVAKQNQLGRPVSKKRQRSQAADRKPSKRSKVEGNVVEVASDGIDGGGGAQTSGSSAIGSSLSLFAAALVKNKSLLSRVEAAELTKEILEMLLVCGAFSPEKFQSSIREALLKLEEAGHTDTLLQRLIPFLRADAKQSSLRTFALNVATGCFSKAPKSASSAVCMPALKLLQHMSMDASDKADCRKSCAIVICEVLDSLPAAYKQATTNRFYGFLDLISQSKQPSQRCLAIEIAACLICHRQTEDQDLLEILCSRSKDKAPQVRVATLRSIGEILPIVLALENEMALRKGIVSMLKVVKSTVNDAKPVVRKQAVKALVTLLGAPVFLKIRGEQASSDSKALVQRCHDVASSIRAAAVEGMNQLVIQRLDDTGLLESWVNVVLPCVMDTETSVRNKAVRGVDEILFQRLAGKDPTILSLLDLLTEDCFSFLTKAVEELSQKVFSCIPMMSTLTDKAGDASAAFGVWTMLEFFCMPCTKNSSKIMQKVRCEARQVMKPELISQLWSSDPTDDVLCKVLTVAMGIAEHIPASVATSLAEEMLSATSSLSLAPRLIQRCLQCLSRFCDEKTGDEEQSREMIRQWGEQLLHHCADKLSDGLEESTEATSGEVCNALFLAGELAVLGFDPDDRNPPFVRMNEDITTLVMGFLTEGDDQQERPESVRAYAIVSTGKMCMVDKNLAERAIHMMIREMNTSEYPTVRANVMVILGDLCRRYTSLIDRHLDSLGSSLCDPVPLVRRHAVIILTGLLQEDYIKWRSSLFCRFVAGIVDEDKEIASLVKYALTKIFPTKAPHLIPGNFVEIVFALNGCSDHDKYKLAQELLNVKEGGKLQQAQITLLRNAFASSSQGASENREKVFSLLLQQLADHQRLEITNKLCRDVIGSFVSGALALPSIDEASPRYRLFVDTFTVLCSPDIKVKASQASDEDSEQMPPQTKSSAMEAAKRTVITKLERKNVIENVVPLLLSLYRKLQKERSGLIKYVAPYFAKLMKEFKTEVDDVLGADNRVIADEIAFDLRKAQEAEAEAERQEMVRQNREAARRTHGSSTAKRRKSLGALGIVGRTPIPSHKKLANRSARRGSLGTRFTPRTTAGKGGRPILQPRTAPRLRAVENIPVASSTGGAKKITLKVTTARKLPKPWSVKQPKELPGSVRKDEKEGKGQQDLTSTLMDM